MARMREGGGPGDVVIPHDPISEGVLVAAALTGDDAERQKLLAILTPSNFIEPTHQVAWEGIQELERRKLSMDIDTLQKVQPKLDRNYIEQLLQTRPKAPENLSFHLQQVLWDGTRLNAARGPIHELVRAIQDPKVDPERVKSLARQVSQSFENYQGRNYLRDPNQVIHEMMTDVEARRQGVESYSYGIDRLDYYEKPDKNGQAVRRMIPGAYPGKSTIITGSPGNSKSTFTAGMALGLARNGNNILYGAWEQNSNVTIEGLAAMSLCYSKSRMQMPETKGGLTKEEMVKLEERAHAISRRIRFMDMPFNRSRGEKRSGGNQRNLDIIHDYIARSGCDVFIADLWARCLVELKPEDEVLALERMQSMLEETKVHGILVHQQLTKGNEVRSDRRPTASGAKGSSIWFEVADTMLGLHRPGLYKAIEDNILEVIVLKQRYGRWPQIIEFNWDGDTGKVTGGTTRPFDYGEGGQNSMEEMFTRKKMEKGKK